MRAFLHGFLSSVLPGPLSQLACDYLRRTDIENLRIWLSQVRQFCSVEFRLTSIGMVEIRNYSDPSRFGDCWFTVQDLVDFARGRPCPIVEEWVRDQGIYIRGHLAAVLAYAHLEFDVD